MRANVLLVVSLLVTPALWHGDAHAGAAAPPATADSARFTPESVCREIRSNQTTPITRVDHIPPDVLRVLGVGGKSRMANPGEDWNAGCVQSDKVPGARLVFAARTPHGWFVHSLHGGFVTTQRIVFVPDPAGSGALFWIQQPVPGNAANAPRRTAPWPASLAELQHDLQPEWIVADRSPTPASTTK